MSHNDKQEVVLDAQTEREINIAARRALGKKQHLTFFQRQEAHDIGLDKAMDGHGNLDLNEASNQMHQSGSSSRTNPNVRVSSTYKAQTPGEIQARSNCAKHCGNRQGRTSCAWCQGEGHTQKTERLSGLNKNQARDLVSGE
jgi:hypothetical protein